MVTSLTDAYGNTELHKEASKADYRQVEFLLHRGDKPDQKNQRGFYPLHSAVQISMADKPETINSRIQCLYTLLTAFPEAVNAITTDGNHLSHMLMHQGFEEVVKVFCQNELIASVANKAGHYPVHKAILNHVNAVVPMLLDLDGVTSQTDKDGHNALDYAAMYGDEDLVQEVAKRYQDLNQRDREGNTPLLLAAAYGNEDAMKVLKEKGADESAQNLSGQTYEDILAQRQLSASI